MHLFKNYLVYEICQYYAAFDYWPHSACFRLVFFLIYALERTVKYQPTREKCHAFYIKASYECYLKGLDKMHVPKPLKEEFGGGNKEFNFKEMTCFKDVENFELFLNSQERQAVLIFLINRLRAHEGT